MTSKIKGTEGVEFPDASVQSSAAFSKSESAAAYQIKNIPFFSGSNSGSGTISSNVATKLILNSVAIDTHSWWNAGLTRYIPQLAGYYRVTVTVVGNATTSLNLCTAQIAKNGVVVKESNYVYGASLSQITDASSQVTLIIAMNGTTDYIEPFARLVGVGTLAVSNFLMQVDYVRGL